MNKLKEPAIRIFGNILNGNSVQTQVLLNLKVLDVIDLALDCTNNSIKKEALWALSNIAAGTRSQISEVVEHCIIKKAMIFLTDENVSIRKEALYTYSNIINLGTHPSVQSLINLGILTHIKDSFDFHDTNTLKILIDICKGLLKTGKSYMTSFGHNFVTKMFEDVGVSDKIQNLKHVQDQRLQKGIDCLIEEYFQAETDLEVVLKPPNNFEFS